MSKLFIRSQNKKIIEQVSSVNMYDKYEGNPNSFNGYEGQKYVGSVIEVNGEYFGTYKTTERAMQVLDEICVALSGKFIAQPKSTSKAKVGVVGESGNVEAKPLSIDTLYQMPQE